MKKDRTIGNSERGSRSIRSVRDIATKPAVQQLDLNFGSLFTALSDAVIVCDLQRRIQMVNPAAEAMFGYPAEELIGITTELLYHDKAAFKQTGREVFGKLGDRGSMPFSMTYRHKNGSFIYAETIGAPVCGEDGRIRGYIGIHRDIGERNRMEDSLRRSRERLIDIMEGISDGFITFDNQHRIEFFNRAAEEYLGRRRENVIGKTLLEAFPQVRGTDLEKLREHILKEQKPITTEIYFAKEPYANWYEVRAYPDRNGVSLFFRVTTEQKEAQQSLLRSYEALDEKVRERTTELLAKNRELTNEMSERRDVEQQLRVFRDLINQSHEAIAIIDQATSAIIEANEAAAQQLGYESGSFEGIRVADFSERASGLQKWEQLMMELGQKGALILEDRARCKDGSYLLVEVSLKLAHHENRQYVLAIVRDIAKRKEMEDRIALTNAVFRLSAENISRSAYLEALSSLLRKWNDCQYSEIRMIVDGSHCISHDACSGLDDGRRDHLRLLQIGHGQCACLRVVTDRIKYSGQEFTPGGSFWCNNTTDLLRAAGGGTDSGFWPQCIVRKYQSVAIVPIRHRGEVLGLMLFADSRPACIPFKYVEVLESLSETIGEAVCRHNVENELIQSREQLRKLTAHIQEVREDERTAVAREVHDELGQVLTALKIELSWLAKRYIDHQEIAEKSSEIIALVNESILTVKRIVTELRPSVLDHLGLAAAVEWQLGEFRKLSGIDCSLEIHPGKIFVDEKIATNLFRIFQEILTNILRHAEASEVSVRLEQKEDGLRIRVTDNGKGIADSHLSSPTSFGLVGMRERVRVMNGEISIRRTPSKGTEIEVVVPHSTLRFPEGEM